MWGCRCTCGTEKRVFGPSLTRGRSTSCGCLARELTAERSRTHGQIHTRLYKSWADMIGRATWKEQARNKRTTIRVTFQGVTKPLAEWCELLGLNYRTVYYRIHRHGWSVDRALSTTDV